MTTDRSATAGWRASVALALMPLVSGCIVIPVPDPGETHVVYMEKGEKQRITIGKSSQQDVLQALGSPTALAVNPSSVWMYSVNEYLSTGWEWCVAWIFYEHLDGGCPKTFAGEERYSYLEIRFDEQRLVSDRKVASLAAGDCTDAGFCWDGKPTFTAVRGVRPGPAWHCAVHFFTPNQEVLAELDVMGAKHFDLVLTSNNFQILLLQTWEPEITLSFADGTSKRLPVSCKHNSANFLVVFEDGATYSAVWVPEQRGRLAVMHRQTLTPINFN